jgi:hypothetical protein
MNTILGTGCLFQSNRTAGTECAEYAAGQMRPGGSLILDNPLA